MMILPVYLAIITLVAAAYLDRNFWRVLVYSILINLVMVSINAQTGLLPALSFAIFSVVLFPALMYVTIKNTRHEDDRKGMSKFVALLSLPVMYVFLTWLGLGDAIPLYLVFLFSVICISTIRNTVRLLFFVYILENAILLLSGSIIPGAFTEGLASTLLIDSVAFLPVVLMAYLTVRLYKNNRGLDIWQIW